MKPLKATEISYIIEAQIRGVSVFEVLGKKHSGLKPTDNLNKIATVIEKTEKIKSK